MKRKNKIQSSEGKKREKIATESEEMPPGGNEHSLAWDQGSTDRKVGPRGPSDPFRSAVRTGLGPAKFLKKRTGTDHGPRKI